LGFKHWLFGWQTQEAITDVATHQYYPNFIWALHPTVSGFKTNRPESGYAFIWVDGTTIKFYKSSDLSWPGANNPPSISNPYPVNGSTNIDLQPTCHVNVSDSDGDTMTVYWYENTTGSWVLRQTNTIQNTGGRLQ